MGIEGVEREMPTQKKVRVMKWNLVIRGKRDSDPFQDESYRIAGEGDGEVFNKCSRTIWRG